MYVYLLDFSQVEVGWVQVALAWAWASCLHVCPPLPTPQEVKASEGTMEDQEEEALVSEVVVVGEEEEQAGTEVSLARPSKSHKDHTKVSYSCTLLIHRYTHTQLLIHHTTSRAHCVF